jgi:hypothetical protein
VFRQAGPPEHGLPQPAAPAGTAALPALRCGRLADVVG